ncbi:trypsin-like peptidase domain-containing protein [Kribbella sp. C-35]|uniref:trypsin-like peptidase domain-containing protein n=1 Tax=Kribbella sp. C-35 TaxID=2789276 RepID=UPI00397A02BA
MTAPFLTKVPLDLSDTAVRELIGLLSDVYYHPAPVIKLVREINGKPGRINWDQPMQFAWIDVCTVLANEGKLSTLLDLLINSDDQAVATRIKELTADHPVTAAPAPTAPSMQWFDGNGSFEKFTQGRSTLLDIAFLQRGFDLAPAVVRLLVTLGGAPFYGTAFRIGPDLFLTNHHVLFWEEGKPATSVEAWFGYERSFGGPTRAHVSLPGDVSTIQGAIDHDWAVVRINGKIPDGTPILELQTGATVSVDDRVYIIQHPQGGVKKIGMVHNVVKDVTDDVILYWTDTDDGSSGSPIFDEQWQVVGLHHYWTSVRNGRQTEIRNQGRRIERVVEGLVDAGVM